VVRVRWWLSRVSLVHSWVVHTIHWAANIPKKFPVLSGSNGKEVETDFILPDLWYNNLRRALFEGLVYDEAEQPVEITYIGQEPYYVVLDDDFKRHVPAEEIDRQVIEWLQQQAAANKDLVSEQMMKLLGKEDLFTKAMIDSSITNMEQQVMQQGLPDDARIMLGMMGFKIIVNIHGELVNLDMPTQEFPEDGEW
jgi:hypothetical protein